MRYGHPLDRLTESSFWGIHMTMRTALAASAVTLAIIASGGSAAAGTLFGINDSDNSLVIINPEAATVTTVGSLGVAGGDFGDLAYDSTTGTAYWAAGRGNNNLYSVNLTTGAASLIGNYGVNDLFGLTFDTANNTLYGFATNQNVYTINVSTGASTILSGNHGLYPGGAAYVAATDTIYLQAAGGGGVNTIDAVTGAGTFFSAGAGAINDNGLTWDVARGRFFANDYSGNVYSYAADFNSRSLVLNYGSSLDGIISVETGAVPEPATWAMMLLGFFGLGAAIRSRKSAALAA